MQNNTGELHQILAMIIDITTTPIFLITIDSAKERHKKVESIFNSLNANIIHINGEILDKTGLSFMDIQTKKSALVANAHIKALKYCNPPFLILEDDVNAINKISTTYEIPDDTDAFYLGTSVWGMLNGQSVGGGTRGKKINSDISKVWGMLGIHAIAYITQAYVDHTIKNLENCISLNRFCDECIAEDMINHNVYCVNEPVFYQDDGHNDKVTLFPFKTYLP
jgi:hypothetical protein